MNTVFSFVSIAISLVFVAVIAFALFWVVRLGVRFGLRDHDRWRESRSSTPPSAGA